MTHEEPQAPLELGKNRIEALADGIFAIAMTLLILDVRIPNLPGNATDSAIWLAVIRLWPKLLSYAIAFLSLGVFWVGHHNMFHGVRRTDRTLLWLNIFFFMFVSFVPFSTSLVASFPRTIVGPLVFGINLSMIGWILFLQWFYACGRSGMVADFHSPSARKLVRDRFLAYPLISCVTTLATIHDLPISLSVHCLLLPLYMIPGKLSVQEPVPVEHETDPSSLKHGPISTLAYRMRPLLNDLIVFGTMGEEHTVYRSLVIFTATVISGLLVWSVIN